MKTLVSALLATVLCATSAQAGSIPYAKAPESIRAWIKNLGSVDDPDKPCGLIHADQPEDVRITREVFSFGVAYIAVPYTGCTGSGAGIFSVWMTKHGKLTLVLDGEGVDTIHEEDGKIVSYWPIHYGMSSDKCRSIYVWKNEKLVESYAECAVEKGNKYGPYKLHKD